MAGLKERLPGSPAVRRWAVAAAVAALALWVFFLDSHSVSQRWQYAREAGALRAANAELEASNAELRRRLEAPLSDEVVERMAREEYGMQRAGETVYRVETAQ